MIEIKNLTKFYYSSESVALALDDISLKFEVGDFVAVTGESGSGKSTLLKVIHGTETYEDGEMCFDGVKTSAFGDEDWDRLRREEIAVVYQDYQILDNYSVLENVESVLLICEDRLGKRTAKERRAQAMSYLDIVGLTKQAKQKASHISSGQKQRLGIARALAKQTKIILADEPTGNLDTESGRMVMDLFGKLAKEHLVIVVTHNIEQAEDYITRRVRLYDGTVSEDVRVKPNQLEAAREMQGAGEQKVFGKKESGEENQVVQKAGAEKKAKGSWKRYLTFSRLELKGSPLFSLLLFLFFLCSAFSVLFALGIFAENQDALNGRAISSAAFANTADIRLVIRTMDDSAIEKEELAQLRELTYVNSVEAYDTVSDIAYAYKQGVDYEVEMRHSDVWQSREVTITDYTKFMRSETCITEADLAKGHLPRAYEEIVVGADDADLYGQTFEVFFYAASLWGTQTYFGTELTVVGVCKDMENQVYFSEELCKALSTPTNTKTTTIYYEYERKITYKDGSREEETAELGSSYPARIICNPSLADDEVKISEEKLLNLADEENDELCIDNTLLTTGTLQLTDLNAEGTQDVITQEYEVKVSEGGSISSERILEVGQGLFDDIFGETVLSQASIYIDYYAHTDEVLKQLEAYGYDLVSVIRVSAGNYDYEKVNSQLISLAISAGAALIFLFVDLVVLVMMLRTKRKSYQIFRALGMEKSSVTMLIVLQIVILAGTAFVLAPLGALIAAGAGVARMQTMLAYINAPHMAIYLIYLVIVVFLSGVLGNRSDKKARRKRFGMEEV